MPQHSDRIIQLTLRAQERVFRLAARDYGLTLKAISLDSNIPYETLRSYAGHKNDQAVLPVSAVNKLIGVIPDDLLSHLFEPGNRQLVVSDDDNELDALGEHADAVAAEVRRARHPMSDGGTDITDAEASKIRTIATKLRRVA
jgi:hypothetical protein